MCLHSSASAPGPHDHLLLSTWPVSLWRSGATELPALTEFQPVSFRRQHRRQLQGGQVPLGDTVLHSLWAPPPMPYISQDPDRRVGGSRSGPRGKHRRSRPIPSTEAMHMPRQTDKGQSQSLRCKGLSRDAACAPNVAPLRGKARQTPKP